MAGTTMWLNEINYFSGGPGQDFVEVAVPVENSLRPAFTVHVYAADGTLFQTLSQVADPGSGNGIQYIKIGGLDLPDTGIAVALVRDDGFVRQFISFGTGGPVTAIDGPMLGTTSSAVYLSDTNPTRNIGLVGSAAGPDGWTWQANVADIPGGRRNAGQTHTPTSNVGVEVFGGAGNNMMVGTTAGDILSGEDGNDTLFGLAGNDTLNGGEGNDLLIGGAGADSINGGNGADTASYISSIAGVTINLVTGVHLGNAAGDTFSSIENFRLTASNDVFTMNDDGVVGSVNLVEGDDIFHGGAAADRVTGGLGNDTINGGGGADNLNGQVGNDIVNGGDGADTIRGEAGNDALNGDAGNDVIYGGTGEDTISGGDENDRIYGNEDNDILYGDAGNDVLVGGAGDDELFGGDGNDNLFGEAGADLFVGGLGNDVMVTTADGAVDTFQWDPLLNEGLDTINGFQVGDVLDFGGLEYVAGVNEAFLGETIRWTQIELTSGTVIRVLGVTEVDLFGAPS
jgi:Ca2+-binding RTX toxin-like protein